MTTSKTWFITGASQGLGLILANQLLAAGHRVAATSRHLTGLTQAIPADAATFLPLQVDLTDEASVAQAVQATISTFGRIDVVVNNAGYGQFGSIEELSDQETRQNFDINVFGLLNVLRHVSPHLRAQQSGQVFNISSIGGFFGNFPGWGIYCATKFAVEGLTEAYAAEMAGFGVKVTAVMPGYFRTNFLSAGSLATPHTSIAAYQDVRDSLTTHQEQINGQQPGDPAKAVALLIAMSEAPQPPLYLFLGADAYQLAAQKITAVQRDMQQWQSQATATDFAAEAI
ncbi:oxidoreductase [Hymenobacter terrenus]|uniref:oxidoreductase n=1 Tax=Hymenobacter terrenus TaxID=1629124 RepID=UPI00061A0A2E|nr:oxidoreductase [Hymenobacter terrenus]